MISNITTTSKFFTFIVRINSAGVEKNQLLPNPGRKPTTADVGIKPRPLAPNERAATINDGAAEVCDASLHCKPRAPSEKKAGQDISPVRDGVTHETTKARGTSQ